MAKGWRKASPKSPYAAVRTGSTIKREHVVLAEQALGKPLPSGAVVHHYDGNTRNNSNRNLVICQDTAFHHLLHRRQRVRDAGGDPNADLLCSACKQPRPKDLFAVRRSGPKAGQPIAFCQPCNKARRKTWGEQRRGGNIGPKDCPERVREEATALVSEF